MLRWTNLNMLAHYTHGFEADKLEAQGAEQTRPFRQHSQPGAGTGVGRGRKLVSDGGRYRIRTYDFHRVKVATCFVIRELR